MEAGQGTTRRRLRHWRGAVAALAGSAALCAGAEGALAAAGPQGIRPGHNITVFHDIDMVGAYGHAIGAQTQVDVFRGAHRIATARGAASSTPDGGALEVNHGPAGAAQPGDCWEGATPDIRPGDRVVVSNPGDAGGVDEAIVDDIAITARRLVTVDPATNEEAVPIPVLDPVTGEPTGETVLPPGSRQEVWVEGSAWFMNADGTRGDAIPLDRLDSGGFIDLPADNQLRLGPNLVQAPLGIGTFRARYFAPFNLERNRNNHSNAYILNALATGDAHSMGYGHVVPLPPVAMLVEGLTEQSTAALGCESAPKEQSSVGTTSVDVLNLANTSAGAADLTVGGWVAASVTSADVLLTNGAASVAKSVALSDGSGPGGFSASFDQQELAQLGDGTLTARLRVDGTAVGAAKAVLRDTIAPAAPRATPAGGDHAAAQSVLLSAEPAYEFPDWGKRARVRGGSHGSLHRVDSLGALLFCGVQAPPERAAGAWSIADVAPMVLAHFDAG